MTGQELRQLILNKWGHSYDVQLRRTQGRIMAQVMWRYQEQASFPLSETDYLDHLNAIAAHLNDWGTVEQVKEFIVKTKSRPRLGKAVNIPLELGVRSLEWLVEDR
ncbi:DUF3067 family protein [Tumidithrix elongata RA019]|uniref:DUF3067 family protein n=1 Tax=Tumidithrix elongata BACA0141 TaxID=2716417 RepID=A0AAW9Q2S5_9CYAN|nr:DUF3067 family protein [Tumidithrix elongata RA019]